MTQEDKLSHLGVRYCGEIVTLCGSASLNLVLQVVFERFEDANDDIADVV